MRLQTLFNTAAGLARHYDGSEPAYDAFMGAAIAYDDAGGAGREVDRLLDTAIDALNNGAGDDDILAVLQRGGAQVFHHGEVFVRPDPQRPGGIVPGEERFTPPQREPRLREVALALQRKGIYFDDLIIDAGRVGNNQMRRQPYVIVTIPRLNAQIAVADQAGEALFVANPALPFMNWALFEKDMAGKAETPFAVVTRIVHAGAWQDRMIDALFGADTSPGPKVNLPGYVKAQRKAKYPLTEAIVVAMARMTRERDPERQWPSVKSGAIYPAIVEAVTGDPHWQDENWKKIDSAGHSNYRGLTRTLPQTLKAHGCSYDLTEEMVLTMARMTRERNPDRQWPGQTSGAIDPAIVQTVTGDPLWQAETWSAIDGAGRSTCRGLTCSLPQTLKAHGCSYDLTEDMVVAMARMARERDPDRRWPAQTSDAIDPTLSKQSPAIRSGRWKTG